QRTWALFANRNRGVQMQPTEGQQVLIRGRVSLYEGRGDYQVIVDHMQPAGEGALRAAFERLKLKLQAEGIFDKENKRPIPTYPRHVAVVTSPTGAALRDVLALWSRRYPGLQVTVVPTPVQGEEAELGVVNALSRAERLGPDAILLTRGGGSLEDLWTFNMESVARAIMASSIPIVSAVGHEIDITISDMAADLRAPTPTAGAELLVPDLAELHQTLTSFTRYFVQVMQQRLEISSLRTRNLRLALRTPEQLIQQAAQRMDEAGHRMTSVLNNQLALATQALTHSHTRLLGQRPERLVAANKQQINSLAARLQLRTTQQVDSKKSQVANVMRMLNGVSPLPTIERGYAVLKNTDDQLITETSQIKPGQTMLAYVSDGAISTSVSEVNSGQLLVSKDPDGE
ncbi:MAG: exodeoxyribonuclease VII large subunit, partial [Pseudomonadota bacterium]